MAKVDEKTARWRDSTPAALGTFCMICGADFVDGKQSCQCRSYVPDPQTTEQALIAGHRRFVLEQEGYISALKREGRESEIPASEASLQRHREEMALMELHAL